MVTPGSSHQVLRGGIYGIPKAHEESKVTPVSIEHFAKQCSEKSGPKAAWLARPTFL